MSEPEKHSFGAVPKTTAMITMRQLRCDGEIRDCRGVGVELDTDCIAS
jgi:hypothetical protein